MTPNQTQSGSSLNSHSLSIGESICLRGKNCRPVRVLMGRALLLVPMAEAGIFPLRIRLLSGVKGRPRQMVGWWPSVMSLTQQTGLPWIPDER